MDQGSSSTVRPTVHNMDDGHVSPAVFVVVVLIALAVGLGTGFGIDKIMKNYSLPLPSATSGDSSVKKTVGTVDKKKFPDKAEGMMREGGLDGEGSFHLERPGGESQYVYLTSSTVDLSEFVGKKVRVGGQTFQGQKAGWLMDVGYVEVL